MTLESTQADLSLKTPKTRVSLVGAPNSGKTTLYNWLTGSRFKTVNYPGATVEYSIGKVNSRYGGDFQVIDTPGIYSLRPKSSDEIVTLQSLYAQETKPHGIIVVVDGTHLARHLLLALQIKETGFPIVIAVTMSDLLDKQKIKLDILEFQKHFSVPVVLVDGLLGGGIQELVNQLKQVEAKDFPVKAPEAWDSERLSQKSKEAQFLAETLLKSSHHGVQSLRDLYKPTRIVDQSLLHPVWGLALFFVIMTGLFVSINTLAVPLMDWVDGGLSGFAEWVVAQNPESLLFQFLGQGLVSSFAAVVVFVPQIFILFFGLGILESSGYLARAATLIDSPFRAMGLSGRSFVPVLSGFACAVPALMATRNIPGAKERWITRFVIPLMSCSARLPVYALLLGFAFLGKSAFWSGLAMAILYFLSLFFGALTSALLNKFLPQSKDGFLMMELPLYRWPKWNVLLTQSLQKTRSFVFRAGPVIFVLAILLWVGMTFPQKPGLSEDEHLAQSYLGRAGQQIEPVFEPMGLDWRAGIGLISAFAAREVFVSTLAVVYQATGDGNQDEEQTSTTLRERMSEAKNSKGEKVFTLSTVIGLLIFFIIALQCISTVGIAYKESGSLKFALGQLVAFNLAAYVLAIGVVQGLRGLGVP